MDLNQAIRQTLEVAMRDADWGIYGCDGPDNAERATWGRVAWAAHQLARDRVRPTETDVPIGYEIADVICDLLHLAVVTTRTAVADPTVGVGAVLASAFGNFAAEDVHPKRCSEYRSNTETEAATRSSIIGTVVESPTGESGVVVDAEFDPTAGDRWIVRIEDTGELRRCCAEECHVSEEDPDV